MPKGKKGKVDGALPRIGVRRPRKCPAQPPPEEEGEDEARRAGGGAERAIRPLCSLVAQVPSMRRALYAQGKLLAPHLPRHLAHVLTYSRLACPFSQSPGRHGGQHQVHLLLGLRRRAEPPEAAAAAPRRPMQQEAAWGRCPQAEARWRASVRASQRVQA